VAHPVCCICGTSITETFWVCEACERAYDLKHPFPEWPEWVRYLKREEERSRARRDHEIQVIPVSLLNRAERAQVDRLLYGEAEDE
jgi:hypothetical protein